MNNISPDPGYDDKHAGWKIVGDDVVGHFPLQNQLEASDRVISWEGVTLAYIDPNISYKLLDTCKHSWNFVFLFELWYINPIIQDRPEKFDLELKQNQCMTKFRRTHLGSTKCRGTFEWFTGFLDP